MSVATTTAIGIAAGIGAAGSIGGSLIAGSAAKSAAQQQEQAAQNALDFQKQVYNTNTANEKPYLDAGTNALSTLQSDLPALTQGFDPASAGLPGKFSYSAADFTQDPGYQFALQQGQQAIDRSAAARGGAVSGGTLKSLDAYTTGMAAQEYGNAYNRASSTYQQNYANNFNTFETNQSNQFNRLNALVNMGQGAASQQAANGANFANQSGQFAIDKGNAAAAGTVGQANAWNAGISGVASSAVNTALLQGLLKNNGSGYASNANNYANGSLQE